MNITHINVLGFEYIGNKVFYTVEVTEGVEVMTTFTQVWGENQLRDFCNDENIQVSYEEFENEEGEELEGFLQQLGCGYIEVQVDADGSGEHDVNSHDFTFSNGEIERDYHGKHIKTYKRESAAIKFAHSFGKRVVIN